MLGKIMMAGIGVGAATGAVVVSKRVPWRKILVTTVRTTLVSVERVQVEIQRTRNALQEITAEAKQELREARANQGAVARPAVVQPQPNIPALAGSA